MKNRNDERIEEILNSKEFRSIRPISNTLRKKIRKESSRYMFFYNKDAIHGTCERCGNPVAYSEKTTHKKKVYCPHCKQEMEVLHTWRKAGCDYTMKWFVDVKAISNDIVVLRYIYDQQFKSYDHVIHEAAREVFDFRTAKRYQVERDTWQSRAWHVGNYYFIETNMGWIVRNAWCRAADIVFDKKKLFRELNKIDAIQYYDWKSKIGTFHLISDDITGLLNAPLYEKMEKVGLGDMANDDFGYNDISWNPKEKSIVRMLRLDKKHYNLFMERPSRTDLSFLQMYRKIPEADFRWVKEHNEYKRYRELRFLGIKNPITVLNYVERKKLHWYEYHMYLETLKKRLGYDMTDKYYIMPSDFKKADQRASEELQKKRDEEKARRDHEAAIKMKKQSDKIKAISDGLRAMPDLQKFLDGSRGFLVYVPENAEDLMTEGRIQHNCIGTYVDRVASNKTLLFFIRKLDCPDAPFVAMEYCNGDIIQCRYDHNIDVFTGKDSAGKQVMDIDNNLIDFTNALAEILRKNKVMVA